MSSFVRICAAIFAGVLVSAIAPSAQAVSVSPVLFDLSLNPGESYQETIRIENDTESEQVYYTSVQNFVPKGEEGQQTFIENETPSGLMTWIQLDESTVLLKPGQSKEFSFAVRIPNDAEPGGHYAAVFFSTQPPRDTNSVGVGAKTGVLFLVNVSGNVRESLEVESFNVLDANGRALSSPSVTNRLPVHFDLRVRNTGSVHVQPEGVISITNLMGKSVGSVPLNRVNGRALPGSVRRLSSSWGPEASEDGATKGILSSFRSEWEGFAFGRYTATIDGRYGQTRQTFAASLSFWVIPWKLILLALVGIAALLLIVKSYNRMVVRRAMSKASSSK